MAETTVTRPPKRHRFLKILGVIFVVLILLLVVAYFVGTSSGFLKGVILPRAGKQLNSDITVSDTTISPFKEVVLKDLKVTPHGQETLLIASEVRARYSLMDIIRGNLNVDEVAISAPTVTVVENADGSHNYDPLTQPEKEKPASGKQKEEEKKASKPPQVNLKKFVLTDGTIRSVKNRKNGKPDTTEISKLNISLDDVRNGQSGKLSLAAELAQETNPPDATNGFLHAKVNGNFTFALTTDLKPASVQGSTRLDVTQAGGAQAELAGLGADFVCDATPTEVKQIALKFARGGTQLGQLLVSGPLDMAKQEGKLNVQVAGIDKQVLNLAGAASGIDFGPTTLNSSNVIELAKSGSLITAAGVVNLAKLQVTREGQTTPPLDFAAQYDISVDKATSAATIRALTVSGTQKGNQVLKTELTSPMTIAWGNTQNPVGDSTLSIIVNKFNLADWKPFLKDTASSGIVNAQVQLVSQQAGKLVTFNADTHIDDLSVKAGSNTINQAAVHLQAKGQAKDMKHFELTSYQLQIQQNGGQVLLVSVSGTYDQAANTADLQTSMETSIPQLLALAPQPEARFTAGKIQVKAHIVQSAGPAAGGKQPVATQTITGSFALSDLTGNFGSNNFQNFAATLDMDIGRTDEAINIQKLAGNISENGKAGGNLDVTGTYHANKTAQLTAKLINFNENGLRPFLEPALGEKKLASVVLNATAATQYNPDADSSVKADLSITNLVVNDPKNQIPATPLELKLALDTSMKKAVTDIRQLMLTLTPTERAKNELTLSGHIDATDTNAIQGNMKLAADSLDVTRYYDIFGGEKKVEEKKEQATKKTNTPAQPAGTPATSGPEKEPDAKKLPFRNFTAEATIGRFYLRETEITNLQATAKVDGGHVTVNPCQLALNGAPVDANVDADLGVPGYKYNVVFGMKAVPLAPLVNTFAPERKGQIGGTMTAEAKLSGAGITGPSLQKHLAGNFDVTSTNLNLSVENTKNRILKTIIDVVATIPELIRNPAGGAVSALGSVTGLGSGGLSDDLKKSPINIVEVHATAGSGLVNLQNAVVASSAFQAAAKGTVKLNEVLTNSTLQVPVTISLSQALAKKVNLLPADAPTNAQYAALPDFFAMKGTVGDPKRDIKYTALLGIGVKAFGGSIPLGGTAGNLVNGILGTGKSGSATNAPSSSQTGNTLKNLGGILGQSSASNTNASATNPPPSNPTKDLLNNGLNSLFGPKKK